MSRGENYISAIIIIIVIKIMTVEQRVGVDYQPFRQPIGTQIGNGLHCDVFEIGSNEYVMDWVVKKVRPPWRNPIWQKIFGEDWTDRFVNGYKTIEKYCGYFIPPTSIIEGVNEAGEEDLLMVQKRVEGRTLRQYSYHELLAKPAVVTQLDELTRAILRMHKETGRIPDIHGEPQFHPLKQYNMKENDGIIIDKEDKIWLRDVETLGPLWQPRFGGKRHIAWHVGSLHRFRKNLGLADLRKG